jgi:hypothetical protein
LKIQNDVLDVLGRSTTEENILYLPSQKLDRKLYVDVNKCLESIGGKWNKKEKGHIFESDPSDLLDEMINTGEFTDKKKEYQFFETPVELAQRLIDLAEIKPSDCLLEPEAGQAAILGLFPANNAYVAIELMPENCKKLKEMDYSVFEGDFLELGVNLSVDKVIMNPPFTKHQDIKHIYQAWKCLVNGGRLVSIVSESPFFREDKLSKEFRQWLNDNNAEVIDLDRGEFQSSGTMVKSRIIVVNKDNE